MFRFDSDYQEGCLPEILKALSDTNLEQTPGYGEDEYCAAASALIRTACNAPDAYIRFLVGGTQTNATVLSAILRPHQGVLCADSGHINVHETGAVEHSGHKVLGMESQNGKITAAQVQKAVVDHRNDPCAEHMVEPGAVYISFPTELGTIYSKSELQCLSSTCHSLGMPLFVDGARLGYGLSCPECDVTLQDIAALADVFYIGGTKQGALFGEAVVFPRPSESALHGVCDFFKYHVKQNGGLLAKGRLLGLQYKVLFTDNLYFTAAERAVTLARRIKTGFVSKGYPFLVDSPSNQQFPILPDTLIERLRKDFSFEDWSRVDASHTAVRFCTSWATTPDQVDALLAALG